MMSQKCFILILIFYALIVFKTITGYPVENSTVNNSEPFELMNETRYPNGTVVGEFSYVDDDGNPINVKYYADEFNYGVELKSIKIVGPENGTFWKVSGFDTNTKTDEFPQIIDKINIPQEDNKKKVNFKNIKKSADYETFYRNDIKGLNQCNKDRVRVYLDREKKIIKRALENYQAAKSCGRY